MRDYRQLLEDAIQIKKELQAEEITIKLGVVTEEEIKEMEVAFERKLHRDGYGQDYTCYFFLRHLHITFIARIFVSDEIKKADRIKKLETELAELKEEGVTIG